MEVLVAVAVVVFVVAVLVVAAVVLVVVIIVVVVLVVAAVIVVVVVVSGVFLQRWTVLKSFFLLMLSCLDFFINRWRMLTENSGS